MCRRTRFSKLYNLLMPSLVTNGALLLLSFVYLAAVIGLICAVGFLSVALYRVLKRLDRVLFEVEVKLRRDREPRPERYSF